MLIERGLIKGITTDTGQTFLFEDIHRQFQASEYGRTLVDNVRFSPFKPDDMSNQQWKKLLGPDVCNLEHNRLAYARMRAFLGHLRNNPAVFFPSEVDQASLLFTALIHDWPEAMTGDKPDPLKTKQDTGDELAILPGIIEEVLGIPPEDSNVHSAVGILDGGNASLWSYFRAVEVDGYSETAVRAWLKTKENLDPRLTESLRLMAFCVTSNHTPQLIAYARRYPPIMLTLKRRAAHISDVFKNTRTKTIDQGIRIGLGGDSENFLRAKKDWERFTNERVFRDFQRPVRHSKPKQIALPI